VRGKQFLNFSILILLDISILISIFYISTAVRDSLKIDDIPQYIEISISDFLFAILTIEILLISERIYSFRFDFWQETKKILKALLLSYLIVLTILALTKSNLHYSRLFITIFFTLSGVSIPIFKLIIKRNLYAIDALKEIVFITGDSREGVERFRRELNSNRYLGQLCRDEGYETIFIVSNRVEMLNRYMESGYTIYIVPDISNINFVNSTILEYDNLRENSIYFENRLLRVESLIFKNMMDRAISIATLPIFIPIHMAISILIKLDSKGDILFRQRRIGKGGDEFTCLKYRTMFENSDEILREYLALNPQEVDHYSRYHKYRDDPRVTKFGRFLRSTSLDELPQILNVLRGDMSIVGPRPYMVNEVDKLGEFRDTILRVKPGITGLWQVSGRNNLTFQERMELESWYIKNWSLWGDFIILLKTFSVVFRRVGAK